MNDDVKKMAALTALNDQLAGTSFSICTLDAVATMLGVNPKGESYDILRTLHCIHYSKMPQDLRDAIPDLIRDCVGHRPTFQFKDTEALRTHLDSAIVATVEAEKPRGLLRLLGGGR